jgi:hypothetical protein
MREQNREQLRRLQHTLQEGSPQTRGADPVERVLDDLAGHPRLAQVRLTPNFLNDVGYVLERDGFGAAQAYMLDRTERPELSQQARFLLEVVLPRLKACPPVLTRRALGRYIIKVLPALQRRESGDTRAAVSSRSGSPRTNQGGRRP